jgi:hypothetical protein
MYMERLTSRIGFWSAVLSFVFGLGYIVFQAADWAGLTPAPWSLMTLTFPSFWLALSFVILMISIYHYASDDRKIWGHIAVAFAIMYAALNAGVYFLQMTVVVPFMLNGQAEEVAFITLKMGTFIYGLDVLGYSLMSLATLFAAPVFVGGRLERWVRWSLIANGLLTPALLLQQNFPTFAIAALWAITFPIATALLAVLFKRKMK